MSPSNDMTLNLEWERRIRDCGADFVRFADITGLPEQSTAGFPCAVIFGTVLSREYLKAVRDDVKPATKEIFNKERKMDVLSVKIAQELEQRGFRSLGKLKTGLLPHKTVALRAGLGFIGKNNLLITEEYGCAIMLGKVLTEAPFVAGVCEPPPVRCGDCRVCIDACPTGALLNKEWSLTTSRDEILTRKLCTLCHKCMALCPYTAKYIG